MILLKPAAAHNQSHQYDRSSQIRTFSVGDKVWLSRPVAGKLDPTWEGEWKIVSKISIVNYEISDGKRTRVEHVNRLKIVLY